MKKAMYLVLVSAAAMVMASCTANVKSGVPSEVKISKAVLKDKILGAWSGQTIGCTYGGPTEFKYNGMINGKVEIPWNDHMVKSWFDNTPGLYDDVYMDLTFVNVFQKLGLDAPIDSFAVAFANAPYPLWHANKQGRYNILNGLMPPASGDWHNNAHADDIDFQIEADYAGIMAPGMVNAATHYSDGIGHMMNYGDGWYGGVYVASMYALAFVSDDLDYVVTEALRTIPEQSNYYKAMSDVIKWHKQYPENWELTWARFNKEYGYDIGCPDGVDNPFNIDAVINSGYILIGLLYGGKDFGKTIDIATRCGQDSDCNPASAGGILGCMLGYENIPEYWRKPLEEVMDRNFVYTDISLKTAAEYSFSQALQVIALNGGSTEGDEVTIKTQEPQAVRYEKSFEGHYPKQRVEVKKTLDDIGPVEFEGNGIVFKYHFFKGEGYDGNTFIGQVEVYLDDNLDKTVPVKMRWHDGSAELYCKYDLPDTKHTVKFKFLNKEKNSDIVVDNYLVYSSTPKQAAE